MTFVAMDGTLGEVDLSTFDSAGPGPLSFGPGAGAGAGRQNFPGQIVTGYDPILGAAEFIYARINTTAGSTAGNMVQLTAVPTPALQLNVGGWGGTANSGATLAVVVTGGGAVGQYGWFQISGVAIVACSGAPAVNTPVYFAANNTVGPTAAAGKQVMNATFASNAGATVGTGTGAITLTASQALVLLNRPFNQGAIT
jgi:hypothetical protein